MVDNVAITPGSGDTCAMDDIGGVKFQRVKIVQGADGVNDGDVASGAPLQVTVANTGANATAVKVNVASGGIASGAVASGAIASGAVASGAFASGSIASGAIASGAIAAGAIATGATSIADNEDAASASGDTGVKILVKRSDTAAATSGTDGDYEPLQTVAGKLWTRATMASGDVASGAFASGALASGAVASGAFASGSISSGAIASGAIAAGAIATGATSIAANEDDASNSGDTGVKILAIQQSTPADTAGTNGDYANLQMSVGKLWVQHLGNFVTVSTDIARPGDTTAYAANDAWSDSTTAPTAGGFTYTSAARKSGGSGIITDALFMTSADATTLLQGELWLFNAAVTNVDDNAAFAVSDAEIKTCVGKVPFFLEDAGNNGFFHAKNLNIGFTCSGSANLRFLIRVKNAYTPVSSEVLTSVLKILQID